MARLCEGISTMSHTIQSAVDLLNQPSFEWIIRRPLSLDAASVLAALLAGKGLTKERMKQLKEPIAELRRTGCIRVSHPKNGQVKGAIKPKAVIALAVEIDKRLEAWIEAEEGRMGQ
jgi:hypothetical protein